MNVKATTIAATSPKHATKDFPKAQKGQEKRRTPCAFCDLNHHPSQCLKYKDLIIDDKRKLIHGKNCCLKCLGLHLVRDCILSENASLATDNIITAFNNNKTRTALAISSQQQLVSDRPHKLVNRQQKRFANSLLLHVPVTTRKKHKFTNTYTFLDNGSNDSYLLQSISNSLQLDESLETEEFFIDGFHNSKQITARSVELIIHPFGNLSEKFPVKQAFVLDMLNLDDVQLDNLNSICSSYNHLKDINFTDFDNNRFRQRFRQQVSILIGTNNIDLFTSQAIIKGPEIAPRAICLPFGWTIGGPTADILGNSVLQAYSSHISDINEDAHFPNY